MKYIVKKCIYIIIYSYTLCIKVFVYILRLTMCGVLFYHSRNISLFCPKKSRHSVYDMCIFNKKTKKQKNKFSKTEKYLYLYQTNDYASTFSISMCHINTKSSKASQLIDMYSLPLRALKKNNNGCRIVNTIIFLLPPFDAFFDKLNGCQLWVRRLGLIIILTDWV